MQISAVAVVQPKPALQSYTGEGEEKEGGEKEGGEKEGGEKEGGEKEGGEKEGGMQDRKESSVVLPQWPMGGCGSVLIGTLSASDIKQVDVGALVSLTPATTVADFLSSNIFVPFEINYQLLPINPILLPDT
ncbi:unnamed protein product, partial [Closterium sp. NIES-54]